MEQTIFGLFEKGIEQLNLPNENNHLFDQVKWGNANESFTPAFWATQAWLDKEERIYEKFTLGRNLIEETVACLLGGYGIPAEVGLAAYERLLRENILAKPEYASEKDILRLLSEPLDIDEKKIRYRFAKQKSRYVASALQQLGDFDDSQLGDIELRDWLVSNINGVGLKTASWITRNIRHSDHVAILDIHLLRAGLIMSLFPNDYTVEKHYLLLEESFIKFANAIGVRASILDTLIWRQMKEAGSIPLKIIRAQQNPRPITTQTSLFDSPNI